MKKINITKYVWALFLYEVGMLNGYLYGNMWPIGFYLTAIFTTLILIIFELLRRSKQ